MFTPALPSASNSTVLPSERPVQGTRSVSRTATRRATTGGKAPITTGVVTDQRQDPRRRRLLATSRSARHDELQDHDECEVAGREARLVVEGDRRYLAYGRRRCRRARRSRHRLLPIGWELSASTVSTAARSRARACTSTCGSITTRCWRWVDCGTFGINDLPSVHAGPRRPSARHRVTTAAEPLHLRSTPTTAGPSPAVVSRHRLIACRDPNEGLHAEG